MKSWRNMMAKGQHKWRYLFLFWLYSSSLLLGTLLESSQASVAQAQLEPSNSAPNPGIAPPEFFGMVGRDPWYEWNTDQANFPNQSNAGFLENMAREIKLLGARWVRIEFFADPRPGARGGFIDYAKYDAFINDIAPRYGLKILALIGAGAVNAKNPEDGDLNYPNLNLSPDRPDGSNPYIRFFADRTREIMNHYNGRIAAYELLNEENLWYGLSVSPNTVGALMAYTYSLAKVEHPEVKILVGGIFASNNTASSSVDYLSQIYASPQVQAFYKNGRHYDSNFFPFDGVGWHPYYSQGNQSVQSVRDAAAKMRSWGDQLNKIWVTETSFNGRPNLPGVCGISPGEQGQADYLKEVYSQLVNNQADVATVFWFKYEDFYDQSGYQPWGLVRLEADGQNRYLSGGRVNYYKLAYHVYQSLSSPKLPADRTPPPPTTNWATNIYFQETGHNLSYPFLRYWQENGGVALFGFPITEIFEEVNINDGKVYSVQYFERERLEFHPEAKNPAYRVQLGLLGTNMLWVNCRSFPRAGPLPSSPLRTFFPQTGHNMSNSFKKYWERNGGLAIFGFPVSEEFSETDPATGKTFIVQWFERARFEYHPEYSGTSNEVLLGLLGRDWLKMKGWLN